MNKLTPLLILTFNFILFACSSNSHRNIASEKPFDTAPENSEWNHYVQSFNFSKHQKGCGPKRYSPPSGVVIKSKILLLHGFTACPQQFFEWAEMLSKRGVVVYLFTLPGHGDLKFSDGKDNFRNLPSDKNFEGYTSLAETVNKVALSDELPSSVGGLSVGGAVALHAAAIASTPYEKIFLASPFFKMPTYFKRHILGPIVGNLPGVKNKTISWGEGCHNELKKGRYGYCEFSISQVYTSQIYGRYVMSLAPNISVSTAIQIVGVEKDPGADTNAIKKVAESVGFKKKDNISVCFYRKGANHSLFSRFDSPDENKFWLNSLQKDASSFIELGQAFPLEKSSEHEKGFSVCTIE